MRFDRTILLSLVLSGSFVSAQELGDLATDRPGFTSPSTTLEIGTLQTEQGLTFQAARQNGMKSLSVNVPQILMRFGLFKSLELRFSNNGYSWQDQHFASSSHGIAGGGDYGIGAKFRILDQTKTRPEVAVQGMYSIPLSGSPFSSGGHDPSFTLAAYKDLPGKFGMAVNYNAASVTDSRGRIASTGESVWLSRSVGPFSLFGETFRTTIGRCEGSQTVVDGGLFKGISKNMQIDLALGHTVAGEVPSWYAASGVVVRSPRALGAHLFR